MCEPINPTDFWRSITLGDIERHMKKDASFELRLYTYKLKNKNTQLAAEMKFEKKGYSGGPLDSVMRILTGVLKGK